LFVMVEENFSRIISMFSSANCKIKAHSAEEKFGFRAHLLSILFFPPYDMHAWSAKNRFTPVRSKLIRG
jgi:hypothetical protein